MIDRKMTKQYLEDYAVGQVYHSGRLRTDREQIIAFATQFDPQPYHLDENAARKSVFRGLAASGWHTAALSMRLLVEGEFRPADGVLGVGFDELSWPRPVRPGDELRVESEVLEVRPSKSRNDRGLIRVRTTTFNQHGEPVQVFTGNLLVPRRLAKFRQARPVILGRECTGIKSRHRNSIVRKTNGPQQRRPYGPNSMMGYLER
jgi:acyl dehydratase